MCRWANGVRGAFVLTRIEAKIGVLMIHQEISVLSIMSQHLWRKKHAFNELVPQPDNPRGSDPTVVRLFSYPTS